MTQDMTQKMPQIGEEYFRTFSREAMRILKHMVEKWPKRRVFYTEELGRVIGLEGKALGGVLGTFSKRETAPIVVKVGTASVGWDGERYSRPKQVWTLNPKLRDQDVNQIRSILKTFLLEY